MQEHVALQSKGHIERETRRIEKRMPLQLTGEEMKESSQNVSGQQNTSSQLNTGCLVNALPNYSRMRKILFVCHGNICR